MSGIAGIFHRDGCPVAQELFARTLASLSHRGPDGNAQWVNKNIALGHQKLCTTPESLFEKQPLLDEAGQICLVLHGRVDNRQEVKKALVAKGAVLRTDTDAEIFLQAYIIWGESFPVKIIGDFAVAIWDARKQHLFCARDVWGVKPFYYGLNGQSFIFSSDVRAFFVDPSFPCEPNEGFVGELLANNITSTEDTLYQQIFRIPPAHTLIVDARGIRKQRYWDFDGTKEIRYRTDAEYAEHFLELFTQVLIQHMRSARPVGADLSGGLDSSAIVCLAHSLFEKGALPKNGFETFSLMFPDHKEADESKYINDVVQMWNVKANLLGESRDPSVYARSIEHSCYIPSPPNGHMMDLMKIAAQEKGFRVMLTGIGGDEFLTGSLLYCADLVKRGQFLAARKQARDYQQIYRSLSRPLLHYGIFPLLRQIIPEWVLDVTRPLRHRNQNSFPFAPMTPEFVARINLRERLRGESNKAPFKSYAQNDIYQMMRHGWFSFRFEMEERDDALLGFEYRFPLHDRRMAEFCLALPESQRWRGAQPKFILRQAMINILPESIRKRTDKGDFTFTTPQCFEDLNGMCFSTDSVLANRGWVDGEHVQTMYQEMMQLYYAGDRYPVWQLWMIFALELWLRKTFLNETEVVLRNTLQYQRAGA